MAISKVTVNTQAEFDAEVITQRAKTPKPFFEKRLKTQSDGSFPWDVTFTDQLKTTKKKGGTISDADLLNFLRDKYGFSV